MNYSDFTIVLPTLNERATVGKLIARLLKLYPDVNVLVMDDGSKDGTIELVRQVVRRHRQVRIIDRSKLGLAKGLTASVVHGILESKTKYAIVMDADMQHPPEVVGKIAKKLMEGNDLVVAVRTSVPHWSLYRKLISKSLMLIGLLVLFAEGKRRCRDIFSGFFGVKRDVFVNTYLKNKKRFVVQGYKVLFDFLKSADKSLRINEVGYVFRKRKEGKSKAGIKQGLALFESFIK